MPPTMNITTEEITSFDELNARLKEANKIRGLIVRRTAKRDEAIRRAVGNDNQYIVQKQQQLRAVMQPILDYAESNRDFLLRYADGNTLDLPHAQIQYNPRPEQLSITGETKGEQKETEQYLIEQLLGMNLDELVRTSHAIDKRALIKRRDVVEDLDGIEVVKPDDNCEVTLRVDQTDLS